MNGAIWITWENQRRSVELAKALDVPLFLIEGGRNRWLRYLFVIPRTLLVLVRRRPGIVFVQNPSVVLAAIACLLRSIFRYYLVVDRHSNFDFSDTESGLVNRISNFTIRTADLTIVTNDYVRRLIESKGGRGFILPDRLPTLQPGASYPFSARRNVVFVCTYKPDEPVADVIEAARLLPNDVRVYVTGNDRRLPMSLRERLPPNVVLTGFLASTDYDALIAGANVVLELTLRDHTLLCGAYEAVSVGTPLVISNKEALTAYFRMGTVVSENTAPAIAAAILDALRLETQLRSEVALLRRELVASWAQEFEQLWLLVQHGKTASQVRS